MRTIDTDWVKHIVRNSGSHFFDAATMRFFNSRVSQKAYENKTTGDMYFVTSESYDMSSPRLFTVRRLRYTVTPGFKSEHMYEADVSTMEPGFQAYASRNAAHRMAKRYATKVSLEKR